MLRAVGLVITFLNSWRKYGRFSDNFVPVNTLKRITRPFLQSISIIRLQITFGEFALFLTQLGRLAHCPPSTFTHFFRFRNHKGSFGTLATEHIHSVQFVCKHIGSFGTLATEQIHSVQFVCHHRSEKIGSTRGSVRAGHFMSLLSHHLQSNNNFKSKMLSKKNKPNNSLSNTVAKQYKLYSPYTEGFQHELSSRYCGL